MPTARSFFGQRLQALDATGFRLTATQYGQGLRTPRHQHEFAYLSIVMEGAAEQQVSGGVGRTEAGEMIFHPPGEWHSDRFLAPKTRLIQFEIFPELLRRYPGDKVGRMTGRSQRCQWLAASVLQELRNPDEATPLAVEGLGLELLSAFWREKHGRGTNTAPDWVVRARELVQDRFPEHLTLTEVAEAVGVSAPNLARAYRRYHRCTLGEDLRRCRIEFACRQLSSTRRPLAEIATAAGFCDQAHFTRSFQRALSMSPGIYRLSHRG